MGFATGTLDTNVKLAASSPALALTSETVVSVYVFGETGAHAKHEVILQVSPDGIKWVDHPGSIRGEGVLTATVAATHVRACVLGSEGAVSTASYHLVAR